MENEFSKHFIYGNFLSQSSECFPLDAETLAMLQSDVRKFAVLALVAGCDCLILSGCEYDRETLKRGEGYVFLRNAANPLTGEVFYHPEQTAAASCSVAELSESVTANGSLFENAYVTRYLKEGGSEFLWADFKDVKDISNTALKTLIGEKFSTLETRIGEEQSVREAKDTELRSLINAFSGVPVGTIAMWSNATGEGVPSGWTLCSGGTVYSPTLGRTINVPNLTNRFIRGGSLSQIGRTGGNSSVSVTLTTSNMPSHTHTGSCNSTEVNSGIAIPLNKTGFPDGSADNGNGSNNENGRQAFWRGKNGNYSTSHYHSVTIGSTGGSQPFTVSTLPPYYYLSYIMKI